eukprot:Sspe_Gene.45924::Locus_22812_Transcript_1_1_Confidence_1.000_Length_665::g.45924::m.45924
MTQWFPALLLLLFHHSMGCEYFYEDQADLCENTADPRGGVQVYDATTCLQQALLLMRTPQSTMSVAEERVANWPPGCYIFVANNAQVILNNRSTHLPGTPCKENQDMCVGVCNMNQVGCICATRDCLPSPPPPSPPPLTPPSPPPPSPSPPPPLQPSPPPPIPPPPSASPPPPPPSPPPPSPPPSPPPPSPPSPPPPSPPPSPPPP